LSSPWIKVEKATARKPEVLKVAELLSIHPDQAFGLCVRFWFWCDDQMKDGRVDVLSNATLDTLIGHVGFANALLSVGWLRVRGSSLEVPNFDRHLSESAKNRALSTERKQIQRAKKQVENVSRKCPTKNGTLLISSYLDSLDESFRNEEFREALTNWITFREEKKSPLTPTCVKQQLKWFAELGCQSTITMIEHTIRKGWIGLREPEKGTANGHSGRYGPGQVFDKNAAKQPGVGKL